MNSSMIRCDQTALCGLFSGLLILAAGTLHTHASTVVSFGSGANEFTMDFVEIGNPGNDDDTTGTPNPVGNVDYTYIIGTYEVSRDMITKANAAVMDGGGDLGITLADLSSHGSGSNGPDRPATGITWYEAATFVNYLNTNQGFDPAYKFDVVGGTFSLWDVGDTLDYDASNPYRSLRANYYLPDVDEWYKAAYYDPDLNGGLGGYWDYATGQNVGDAPTAVASGVMDDTAVYSQLPIFGGPADVDNAGGLSPYGTMAQGGNASEWEETAFDLTNDSPTKSRGQRGGNWQGNAGNLSSSQRAVPSPTLESINTGFRVAGSVVPEPSRTVLTLLGLGGLVMRRRR